MGYEYVKTGRDCVPGGAVAVKEGSCVPGLTTVCGLETGVNQGGGPTATPNMKQIFAATMEYFSMLPSCSLLLELMPLHKLGLYQKIAAYNVICLPMFIRKGLARLCPDYDPYLKAWPRTAQEYMMKQNASRRQRARIRRLLASGRFFDAYEYWWACRRPATRRRLTLPLYTYLGGDKRAFLATMGVFFWSGLLHALWYPLLPVYLCLDSPLSALKVFLFLWVGYSLLGLPVAINKRIKSCSK